MTTRAEDLVPLLKNLPSDALEGLKKILLALQRDERPDFAQWASDVARKYGFANLSEDEVAGIVHQARRSI